MKRLVVILLATVLTSLPLSGSDIESVTYTRLVSSISQPDSPVVSGKYVIFTARGDARHAGISFRHENYATIHSLKRIVRRDEFGLPQKDSAGKPLDTVLFYIAHVPPGTEEIQYRMVINGLWTTDPLNTRTAYDRENRMQVSVLPVERYETFRTDHVKNGEVRFTCTAESGKTIRLAGSFNNWDPFMYVLPEIDPGKYEIILPLPRGTWHYAYFEGTTQLPDYTNPDRVYTRDGRVASVVTIN
ncbi:MAG TPA: isoamylase [Treponemataceae bacterium]|nr:isoamylase [Treponemataceae bacterium]